MTARTESLLEPRPSPLVPFVALSIGVHVLAALYHHFLRKDDTLRRMLPFGRRRAA
jgi:cytochrome b561